MGLDFLLSKSERFVQKRDASKGQELDTADLLSRGKPDEFVRLFRCIRTDPSSVLPVDAGLIARVMPDGQILVLQSARHIGHVIPKDAVTMIEAMRRNHRYGGVLSVRVVDEPDFNDEFSVKSKSPLK